MSITIRRFSASSHSTRGGLTPAAFALSRHVASRLDAINRDRRPSHQSGMPRDDQPSPGDRRDVSVRLQEPVAAIRLLDPGIGAEFVGERAQSGFRDDTAARPLEEHVAFVGALADLVQAVDATTSREDVVQLNGAHRPVAHRTSVLGLNQCARFAPANRTARTSRCAVRNDAEKRRAAALAPCGYNRSVSMRADNAAGCRRRLG